MFADWNVRLRYSALLGAVAALAVSCSNAPSSSASANAGAGAGGAVVAASGAGGQSLEGAGAPDQGQAGAGTGGEAGARPAACEAERAELERAMSEALDAAVADASITQDPDLTLVLETDTAHRFVYTHGDSSLETSYESASTSKWVAASVILDLVDRGVLKLSDEPSAYLPFWQAKGVTLAHLLLFTSGFSKEPLCLNLPNADFADCVQRAYDANVDSAPPPGSTFDYSSVHLQIAGLMAVRASGATGFGEVFAAWQEATGLFPSGAFDLPSSNNPRLAGGMHWKGAEYLAFLRALADGKLLEPATRTAMLASQRGEAKVVDSPVLDALGQDWAYGFGNWLECPTALGPDSFDCYAGLRNSSPGAYGAYPFIDFEHHYLGILARQGNLGTFRDGDALFSVIATDAAHWASVCEP